MQLRQSQCIACPDPTPCNCGPDQNCFQINRNCTVCSQTLCVDRAPSSQPAFPKADLVGAIVGALLFLVIIITLFFFYRRRSRRRSSDAAPLPGIKEVPAPAETVLNRPDPAKKQPIPSHVNSVRVLPPNPFDDTHSIQTARTEGTNVIPIALVAPGMPSRASFLSSSTSFSHPSRPPRTAELNINLDHINISSDSVRAPNSIRSGMTRNSFMSSASYSSDFLNEAPVIVTSSRTAVRQVLGVVKAEVINATASTADSLKPPPARSPLASSSFGPDDIVKETDESQESNDRNPFHDQQPSPAPADLASAHSESTSASSDWSPDQPFLPWKGSHHPASSVSTQGGSIIDIGSATRVNLSAATSSNGNPHAPYRTTMARLINPASLPAPPPYTQVQARSQASSNSRRTSGSSVVSAASRAYSILESFPFVPPSPISDRPVRSPPLSPQIQQSFSSNVSSPLSQHTFNIASPSPSAQDSFETQSPDKTDDTDLPAPPNRRTLALSTISTASSGLGSFPFQIETGSMTERNTLPPVPTHGRQRASLDTLALTNDLTSYPLGIDRDSVPVPVPPLPKKV
ncbi:hypothetical protein APHAL10511_001834 [Amanita phalloides]|nr:hypothetical protein APHAL10511_001834 [Amanita phalloides]